MKIRTVCLTLALSVLAAAPTLADDRVRLLGATRLAHHENDVDIVSVNCRPRVSAIKLRAARGQAEIEAVWVRYGNGERDTLHVRDRLRQSSETRWIDLAGGRRCVVAVGVIGDTELSLDQTRVEIYGRYGR